MLQFTSQPCLLLERITLLDLIKQPVTKSVKIELELPCHVTPPPSLKVSVQ